jgi:hypothetical protein
MFKKAIIIITAICLITTLVLEIKLLFTIFDNNVEEQLKIVYAIIFFVILDFIGIFFMSKMD